VIAASNCILRGCKPHKHYDLTLDTIICWLPDSVKGAFDLRGTGHILRATVRLATNGSQIIATIPSHWIDSQLMSILSEAGVQNTHSD
jgi:hypothetical protein